MSTIAPRGINILEIYDWYRQRKLLVNRRYQRKLVWSLEEKQKLIDSILMGYPLPLIFLAETEDSFYEIIDGMQRLNAVFSFIETSWCLKDKKYFDYKECPTAKLEADRGSFKPSTTSSEKLSREKCARILNYQLAVTVFSVKDEEKINEIFSRINSRGRHLSNQEKRQAGVLSGFSDLVRELSAEMRGDASFKILDLLDMPVISIDTKRERHGYKISAEETFWCRHGILSTKDLRQSDDEEMIADISAGILSNSNFARSKENLDNLYKKIESEDIEKKLKSYGAKKLKEEIKQLFDLIDLTIKKTTKKSLAFRKTVMKKGRASSAKTPFYAVFMAFYELVIKESKKPENHKKIMQALAEVNNRLKTASHHVTLTQRRDNIGTVKGLIQDYFVKEDSKQLPYKKGLLRDLENSFRRSKIETPHYEFKQGFLKLSPDRQFDTNLIDKLAKTACGIANIHPEKEGFIHIGVTDKDTNKIKKLDSITPKKTDGFYVVGIDREAGQQNKSLENYVGDFVSRFKKTKLSEPLKSSILRNMDIIDYYGFSVIRLHIEAQNKLSYMDNRCFTREGSHTKEVTGQALVDLSNFFNHALLKKHPIKPSPDTGSS